MNFYIQKGMKHLVLWDSISIPVYLLNIYSPPITMPRSVEVTACASLWLRPCSSYSGSHPAPRHSAGSGESIPPQPGIAEMVVPVVHCRFQIRLSMRCPLRSPAIPSASFTAWQPLPGPSPVSCVVARLWCRRHRQTFSPFFQLFIPGFQRLAHCTASWPRSPITRASCRLAGGLRRYDEPGPVPDGKVHPEGPVRPVTAGTTDTERLVADYSDWLSCVRPASARIERTIATHSVAFAEKYRSWIYPAMCLLWAGRCWWPEYSAPANDRQKLRHLFAVVDGFVAATCAVRRFFISCASRDMLTPPPDAVAYFPARGECMGERKLRHAEQYGAPEGESWGMVGYCTCAGRRLSRDAPGSSWSASATVHSSCYLFDAEMMASEG